MKTPETKNTAPDQSKTAASETISRRTFVERLRRAAVFAVPVAAMVALTTPKAMGTI